MAFLVAAKKMFVSASQKRIYERFKEAEWKFTYLWYLIIVLGFCIISDENMSWYFNALHGGFLGGPGASSGLNGEHAYLVPCASMSMTLAQQPLEAGPGHKWVPETFEAYHSTCMDTEVELWDKYIAPATYMMCGKNQFGARDFFHPLFLKPNNQSNFCQGFSDALSMEGLVGKGQLDHWDVAIRTDIGGVRGAMVEHPMAIHRQIGGHPRTGFAKDAESDGEVKQSTLNEYRSCSVSPDVLGADPSIYSNAR